MYYGSKMQTLDEKAKEFAIKFHDETGEVRKYTNEACITHAAVVAMLVTCTPHTNEIIAAAWLQNTVERTNATLEDIKQNFGPLVSSYVKFLTDTSKQEDGNRETRKAIDRERLSHAPACVQTIKLASLIDNAGSIIKHDPKFAKVFLAEMRLSLDTLKYGDKLLWNLANNLANTKIHNAEN